MDMITDLPTLTPEQEELRQLLQRAEAGDTAVLSALRRFLDDSPRVWEQVGDLAAHVRDGLVRLVAGDNLLLGESLARKVAALEQELAGEDAPAVERLLAQRLAFCWLEAAFLDGLSLEAGGASLRQGDELRRRRDSANRRFLAGVRQLAAVRRLRLPILTPLRLAPETMPDASTRGRARQTVAAGGAARAK
jgi:hypothetical protein